MVVNYRVLAPAALMISALSILVSQSACTGAGQLEIKSIAPNSGSIYGQQRVTVTGKNFEDGMQVTIGTADCYDIIVSSPESLTCTTPPGPAGKADVTVAYADNSGDAAVLAEGYTYGCTFPPPSGLFAWANDGHEKVTREELRGSCDAGATVNSIWDGSTIKVFGAKNEVVGVNLVLEASQQNVNDVSVEFNTLTGPGGVTIDSAATSGNGVYDYTNRNIELFFTRYLKIEGLSRISYFTDDERHVPYRLRRPWTGEGVGDGGWTDRPDHDKYYPDIEVPLEWNSTFNIAQNTNQAIWIDIYVPKTVPNGLYTGTVDVKVGGTTVRSVPVELNVRNFTLSDTPASKTMVYFSYSNLSRRYINLENPDHDAGLNAKMNTVVNRHFQMAHRHKLSLIDDNNGGSDESGPFVQNTPRPEWLARLNGSLFTAANGYAGPGAGVGNGVYSIGTYGVYQAWPDWQPLDQTTLTQKLQSFDAWFTSNGLSSVTRLFNIADEPEVPARPNVETMAQWTTAAGTGIKSFVPLPIAEAVTQTPSVDVISSVAAIYGTSQSWINGIATHKGRGPTKDFWMYNGKRPVSGSFSTEDDGVALRELPWAQYKKGISRWFVWESTYYADYQGARGSNDLFKSAQTFGSTPTNDPILGKTGNNYGNGEGVLFYPGTDLVHSEDSYGMDGPIASLRMKLWRRGIQDVDYLVMANAINPTRTAEIVNGLIPKVLWEVEPSDVNNPTWTRGDISWPTRADAWEAARAELANIIEGH